MMIGSSIIPPKKRLLKEYRYHAREYDDLELSLRHSSSDCVPGMSLPEGVAELSRWHRAEADKLEKVLDALYPDWRQKWQQTI